MLTCYNECLIKNMLSLIEKSEDINVNEANQKGDTPLIIACKNGNETAVRVLLRYGADLNKPDHDGNSPLFTACNYSNKHIIEYFIRKGAELNLENNKGENPII